MLFYRSVNGLLPCIQLCKFPMNTRLATRSNGLGINVVLQEARRCSWPSSRWILARRRHFPHYDYPPASGSWLRLDVANLCFPNIGTAHFRKSNDPFSDSANAAPIQLNGFHPSPEAAKFLAPDGRCLLLLLLVRLCLHS